MVLAFKSAPSRLLAINFIDGAEDEGIEFCSESFVWQCFVLKVAQALQIDFHLRGELPFLHATDRLKIVQLIVYHPQDATPCQPFLSARAVWACLFSPPA